MCLHIGTFIITDMEPFMSGTVAIKKPLSSAEYWSLCLFSTALYVTALDDIQGVSNTE